MASPPSPPPQPEGGPSATVEESRAALLAHLVSEVHQMNQIGRVQSEALQRTADRINRMEERLHLLEQSNRVGLVETTVQFNTLSNSMGLLQTAQQFNELASLREACGAAPIATAATPGGESAASGGVGSMLPPPVPPTARASGGDGAGPSSLSPEAEPDAATALHQGILHMVCTHPGPAPIPAGWAGRRPPPHTHTHTHPSLLSPLPLPPKSNLPSPPSSAPPAGRGLAGNLPAALGDPPDHPHGRRESLIEAAAADRRSARSRARALPHRRHGLHAAAAAALVRRRAGRGGGGGGSRPRPVSDEHELNHAPYPRT